MTVIPFGARPRLSPAHAMLGGLALLAAAVWVRWAGWDFVSRDIAHFLYDWVDELRRFGFSGLAKSSANYNPPYLYLLLAGVELRPNAGTLHITKAVATLFDVAAACAVAWSVTAGHAPLSPPRWTRPGLALLATLLLPTVWMNSAIWGQSDVIYTFWLLMGFLLAERRLVSASALCFASALAFKLQAAFLGPVVLAVVWCCGRRWQFAAVLVAGYVAWLWPSVWAGRSWADALTVYLRQATSEPDLSLGAPNLWTIAKYAVTDPAVQKTVLLCGLAVAVVLALAAIPFCVRMVRRSRQHILPLAATTAFMVPFLLPKMHDRYFFPADVLSLAMAFRDRRWVVVAALVQIGSATAYLGYLTDLPGVAIRLPGIACNCVAAALLVRLWLQTWRAAPPSGSGAHARVDHAEVDHAH